MPTGCPIGKTQVFRQAFTIHNPHFNSHQITKSSQLKTPHGFPGHWAKTMFVNIIVPIMNLPLLENGTICKIMFYFKKDDYSEQLPIGFP